MGLFDKLKKKPTDTHPHSTTSIPEVVTYNGETYVRKYYYWDIKPDVITDYPFFKDGDQIMFKEEGGKVHAYFDDTVDVGIIKTQGIIDMIYDFVNRGGFYIANINPRDMLLRIGFYEKPDKTGAKPAKMTVSLTRQDFYANEGNQVSLEYDEYEERYMIGDEIQSIKLSEAQSRKIRDYIIKGYTAEAVVVEKEITDDLKNKVKLEIKFQ